MEYVDYTVDECLNKYSGDEGCDYFKKDLARLIDEITDYYLQNR